MADLYHAFAALLSYPDEDYSERVQAGLCLATHESRELLEQFAQAVEGLETWELQELFTRTFDMNPVCSLELGWHLFGENYERGLLLVRVREELRRVGIQESAELPDHLTHILELLARMDHDKGADFAAACVLPALKKMLEALHGKENPFESVLFAVQIFLHSQFPQIPLTCDRTEPLLKVLPLEEDLRGGMRGASRD
ncbi:MAG TPA: nitrate reductase molybdenum cofactor assembly chaperone [Candidatus Sulfotelmatobacter sp.]|nr:nitrate reductase molybdenum cofactor assembly chaperone [Candidatus Sulfotelmatobacter sp.]